MSVEQQSLLDRMELDKKASWRKREPKLTCSHCGATICEYRHKLSEGLCKSLIRLYRFGSPAQLRDLNLHYTDANNFQKLQYWNLIEHVRDGEVTKWAITEKGESFVRAVERVNKYCFTYRGAFRRFDGEMLLIREIVENYDWAITYAQEAQPHAA